MRGFLYRGFAGVCFSCFEAYFFPNRQLGRSGFSSGCGRQAWLVQGVAKYRHSCVAFWWHGCALCGLGRLSGPSSAPFGTVGLGDVLGILRGFEVRVLGDGVEQNGDLAGHGRERLLTCLAVG